MDLAVHIYCHCETTSWYGITTDPLSMGTAANTDSFNDQ